MSLTIETYTNEAIAKGFEVNKYLATIADHKSAFCRVLLGLASGSASIALLLAAGSMSPEAQTYLSISADHFKAGSIMTSQLFLGNLLIYGINAGTSVEIAKHLGYRRFIPGWNSIDPNNH